MNKIIRWVFSQTKLGQFLDGKKTIIGAALVFVSAVLEALVIIAPMFPSQPWIGSFAVELKNALEQIQPYLNDLGISLIGIGLMHKAAKNQR